MRANEDELIRLEKEFHVRLGNKFRFPPSGIRVINVNVNTSDKTAASDDEDEGDSTPKSKRIRDSFFKKISSMPDLQYGRVESFVKTGISSTKKKRLRAQSSIDIVQEFGIYDDNDAGELLMQFADTIKRTSSSHLHMDQLYFEGVLGGTSDDMECESPNVGLTMDDSDSSGPHHQTPPIKIELKDENIHTDNSMTGLTMDELAIYNDNEEGNDDVMDDNDGDGDDGDGDRAVAIGNKVS